MAQVCRCFGISRQCGYEWLRRSREDGWAAKRQLEDRSHRTKAAALLRGRWWQRVMALRRKYRFSGANQLRWYLEQHYRMGPWPSVRTIGRWLEAAGLTQRRRRRALPGPLIEVRPPAARRPNDLWTVDFKGWFRTRDGRRVSPLTVRDQVSRYVLLIRDMDRTTESHVRAEFVKLFRRYGTPRAIRTDNGPPFGGEGPRGWSTLAVWWVRLGIAVELGRPGCPQDNAAHEQMHRVLQQQTAQPSASCRAAQQRRFDRWRAMYNRHRPHFALGMYPPISIYRRSPRPAQLQQWTYSSDCELKQASRRGRIQWRKHQRLIGQAFAGQILALRPVRANVAAVYFGPYLLGELHASDRTAIRAVRHRLARQPGGEAVRLPCHPSAQSTKGRGLRPLP